MLNGLHTQTLHDVAAVITPSSQLRILRLSLAHQCPSQSPMFQAKVDWELELSGELQPGINL